MERNRKPSVNKLKNIIREYSNIISKLENIYTQRADKEMKESDSVTEIQKIYNRLDFEKEYIACHKINFVDATETLQNKLSITQRIKILFSGSLFNW